MKRVAIISIKLNVLQLKLGCFASMQNAHKLLTSALRHQQAINSVAWNNHTLTVSCNEINFKWSVKRYLKINSTQLTGDLIDVGATRR